MGEITEIPAWNFQVLINEFDDDNYWDLSLQEDMPEAYEAITSIGKKYSDISDYEDALDLYNKYEPKIINYYGGEKAIDFIIDEFDTIPIGIIKPPKLKGKLREKYMQGTFYGVGRYYDPITPDEQLEWDKGRFGEDGNPAGEEIPYVTRSLKRALRSVIAKRNHVASTVVFDTDIISQIRDGNYASESENEQNNVGRLSYEEHLALYDKRHKEQDEPLTDAEISAIASNGVVNTPKYILNDSQKIPIDILVKKIMLNSGMNPIPEARRKTLSDAEKRRLTAYLGAENVYDYKHMRKLVKKSEKLMKQRDKEKKRYEDTYAKHRANADRALQTMLTSKSRVSRMLGIGDD